MATICLNMIVKDEFKVIQRCLDSIKDLIHYWVIVDTGSTDGTQDKIRNILKDIPGEIFEHPWVNFCENRNQALEHAQGKADYLWIIDADEQIIRTPNFSLPELTLDAYNITTHYGNLSYFRKQIVKSSLNWGWEGVLHEYLTTKGEHTVANIAGIHNIPRHDGHRSSDPHKYKKDSLVLERALLDQVDHPRYTFYLAQSYRDAGDPQNAIKWYKKRVDIGGWREEVWNSMYNIARIVDSTGGSWEETIKKYLEAYEFASHRAEPLFYLAHGARTKEKYHESYLWSKIGAFLPYPRRDILFVERFIYDYAFLYEFSACSFWSGHFDECYNACDTLLEKALIPMGDIERVIKNRDAALNKMRERK